MRMGRLCIGLLLGLAFAWPVAAEPLKIRFTLDWKLQGYHTWFYWAQEKGYFAAENLDVAIDQGEGSAAAVTRVISGAYDAGFGDMNAIIQTAALRPSEQPVMVYMMYSRAPFALTVRRDSPVKSAKDLPGHKVITTAGAAVLKLLPMVEKANGVDPSKVEILQVSPALQEQMFAQGQADVLASFTATSYMNLVALHTDPDKDFRWIFYADSGIDLYSNGVMVSQKLLNEHPEAVRGLVRAVNHAVHDVVADPDAAIAVLATKEPLINKSIERRRQIYVYKNLIDTPEAEQFGLGDTQDARMAAAIKSIVEAYELPRTPTPAEVFNRSFLPPKADRMPPKLVE